MLLWQPWGVYLERSETLWGYSGGNIIRVISGYSKKDTFTEYNQKIESLQKNANLKLKKL